MTTCIDFLLGEANPDGLHVDEIMDMDSSTLEHKHGWVQWAFPTWERSRYNPEAPTLSRHELASVPPDELKLLRAVVLSLAQHYMDFLRTTSHWRHPNDHNHLRICRMLKCLRLFKLSEMAMEVYAFAIRGTSYSDETRRHWHDALHGDPR